MGDTVKMKSVPNHWPFGEGVLVTASGVAPEDGAGYFWVAACPDGFTQADGKTADEAWAELRAADMAGPYLVMRFPTQASVDRLIGHLQCLREEMEA